MANDPWLTTMRSAVIERASRENWFVWVAPGTVAGAVPAPSAAARVVHLESGLYAVRISPTGNRRDGWLAEMSVVPSTTGGQAKIVAPVGRDAFWFSGKGGVAVISVPPSGGAVMVTTYDPDREAAVPSIEIRAIRASDK